MNHSDKILTLSQLKTDQLNNICCTCTHSSVDCPEHDRLPYNDYFAVVECPSYTIKKSTKKR